MRVNIDSQALNDSRIKALAMRLQMDWRATLGHLIPVWMSCYERRSAILRVKDVEILSGLSGFASAMIAEELADDSSTISNAAELGFGDGSVYIRGVLDRINFLEKQAAKGRISGEVRRRESGSKQTQQTEFEQMLNIGSRPVRTGVQTPARTLPGNGSTTNRTYSPDLDQAPDQAPDQKGDLQRNASELSTDSTTSPQSANATDPVVSDTRPEKIAHSSNGAHSEATIPVKRSKELPPDQALTAAWLLINHLQRNHPTSKIALATDQVLNEHARKWGIAIRKLNEIDRVPYPEIEAGIHWSQRHEFWSTVILSGDNLRAKWDQMEAQRRRITQTRPQRAQQPSIMKELHDHVQAANARDEESVE